MSGPVRADDVTEGGAGGDRDLEITASHDTTVGGRRVRRALPRRGRRTVGAWCFVDHLGPASVDPDDPVAIGPHPHIGLQTVTWLLDGELVHRDSLGTEQPIRPGQLNLMTAGAGVSHAEEGLRRRHSLHGVQLWVAQPEATRAGAAAFEHHEELPTVVLGDAEATVFVGALAGVASPARRDTDHVGADLRLRPGRAVVPLDAAHEHAVVVLDGSVEIDGRTVVPGHLAYLGTGRDELAMRAASDARWLLLGGTPFESPVLMWWNFVARTRDEIERARDDWEAGGERFGDPRSPLRRIAAPPTPWQRPSA